MFTDIGFRVVEALRLAGARGDHSTLIRAASELSINPEGLRAALERSAPGSVHVTGALDRRLLFLECPDDGRA